MRAKELTLGALTVIAGIANAYLWKGVLISSGLTGVLFYSIPVLMLLIFSLLFALAALFIRDRRLRAVSAVVSLSAGYLFIPFTATVGIAALASGFGAWLAASDIAREEFASHVFDVRKILKSGMPLFFTSLVLLFSVFYYSSISDKKDQNVLPKSLFNASLPLVEKPLQGILPGFRAEATVDQLLLAMAQAQSGGTVDVANLSPDEKAQLLAQGRAALTTQFGVKISGHEQASDVLYKVTNAQIEKIAGPYQGYIPLVAAIGFFLAAKALTLPVYWITLILTSLVIKLMLAGGIARKEKAMVEVERINL